MTFEQWNELADNEHELAVELGKWTKAELDQEIYRLEYLVNAPLDNHPSRELSATEGKWLDALQKEEQRRDGDEAENLADRRARQHYFQQQAYRNSSNDLIGHVANDQQKPMTPNQPPPVDPKYSREATSGATHLEEELPRHYTDEELAHLPNPDDEVDQVLNRLAHPTIGERIGRLFTTARGLAQNFKNGYRQATDPNGPRRTDLSDEELKRLHDYYANQDVIRNSLPPLRHLSHDEISNLNTQEFRHLAAEHELEQIDSRAAKTLQDLSHDEIARLQPREFEELAQQHKSKLEGTSEDPAEKLRAQLEKHLKQSREQTLGQELTIDP